MKLTKILLLILLVGFVLLEPLPNDLVITLF